jgi:predicted transcriptional regulator
MGLSGRTDHPEVKRKIEDSAYIVASLSRLGIVKLLEGGPKVAEDLGKDLNLSYGMVSYCLGKLSDREIITVDNQEVSSLTPYGQAVATQIKNILALSARSAE